MLVVQHANAVHVCAAEVMLACTAGRCSMLCVQMAMRSCMATSVWCLGTLVSEMTRAAVALSGVLRGLTALDL